MLDRLRRLFQRDRTIHIDSALDVFQEEQADTIEKARKRKETFRNSIQALLEDIDTQLGTLADYDDPDDRSVIEDVTSNIAADRRSLLDDIETDLPVHDLHEQLTAMIEEFETMTQKEKQVLDAISDEATTAFTTLRELKRKTDDLERFLDETYSAVDARDDLETLIGDWQETQERIGRLEDEYDDLDLEEIESRIEAKKDELTTHREKDAWEELDDVRQRIEAKKDEIRTERSRIQKAMAKMERGLKKIIYQAENGDVTIDADVLETLQELKQGSAGPTEAVEEAAERAAEVVQERDMVDAEERFLDGARELQQVGRIRSRIDDLKEELEDLQDEQDDFNLHEQEESLEDDLADLKDERHQLRERQDEMREKQEELRDQAATMEAEIQELLNEHLAGNITLTTDTEQEAD